MSSPQVQAWCWLCRDDISPDARGYLLHGWPVHEGCVHNALMWLSAKWRAEAPQEASLTGRDRPRRLPRRRPGARREPVVVLVGLAESDAPGEGVTIEPARVEEIAAVEEDEMRQRVTRALQVHQSVTWEHLEQTFQSQGERPADAQPRGRPWYPTTVRGHQQPFLLVDEEREQVWWLVYNHLAGLDEARSNNGPYMAAVMPMTAALRADLVMLGALGGEVKRGALRSSLPGAARSRSPTRPGASPRRRRPLRGGA
ncbi:MAG: hypothetical protein EOO74_00345 [Myxococcales bacterium]|nr:MAG: hypothetical protein EOO74_00345 [Myxococcales bacterium]